MFPLTPFLCLFSSHPSLSFLSNNTLCVINSLHNNGEDIMKDNILPVSGASHTQTNDNTELHKSTPPAKDFYNSSSRNKANAYSIACRETTNHPHSNNTSLSLSPPSPSLFSSISFFLSLTLSLFPCLLSLSLSSFSPPPFPSLLM